MCSSDLVQLPSPAAQVRFQDVDAPPAPAGVRYFILVFGAQSTPKLPRYTHSWATVVKVTDQGPGASAIVEHVSISWLPVNGQVRPWRFRVEPGRNFDLDVSLALTLGQRERVSVWGPYETSAAIYQKFLVQRSYLESGQVGYQAIDTIGASARLGNGRNCIHALTDLDPLFDRQAYPIFRFGDAASATIVQQLAEKGALVNPCQTHDWLMPILGLDRYPLVRRCLYLASPESNGVPTWRAADRPLFR